MSGVAIWYQVFVLRERRDGLVITCASEFPPKIGLEVSLTLVSAMHLSAPGDGRFKIGALELSRMREGGVSGTHDASPSPSLTG